MRTALLVALITLLVGACGSSEPSVTPDGSSPGASSAPTDAGSVVVDTFAMSGTGGKQGPTTDLAGDYVLTTKVKGKTGCAWSVALEGDPPARRPQDEQRDHPPDDRRRHGSGRGVVPDRGQVDEVRRLEREPQATVARAGAAALRR